MEMHLFSKEYDSLYENLWELNLRLDSDGKKGCLKTRIFLCWNCLIININNSEFVNFSASFSRTRAYNLLCLFGSHPFWAYFNKSFN